MWHILPKQKKKTGLIAQEQEIGDWEISWLKRKNEQKECRVIDYNKSLMKLPSPIYSIINSPFLTDSAASAPQPQCAVWDEINK